jgi:cupin fold WbuC family metalloprotein
MNKFKTYKSSEIPNLIAKASKASTRRARILMHNSIDDPIQEMIVALMHDSIVLPHQHPLGSESYYVLFGSLEISWGPSPYKLKEKLILTKEEIQTSNGLRIEPGIWHTTRALSECAVYLEIGRGPFNQSKTIYHENTVN